MNRNVISLTFNADENLIMNEYFIQCSPRVRLFLSLIMLLCCRERPSTLRGGGSIEGGDEARRKRYLTMHDPKGPIDGTEPQDEDQMDQAHLGLSERGQILF